MSSTWCPNAAVRGLAIFGFGNDTVTHAKTGTTRDVPPRRGWASPSTGFLLFMERRHRMSPQWWLRSSMSSVRGFFRRWLRTPTPRTFRNSVVRRHQGKRLFLEALEDRVTPTFSLGAAANYAILYEGGGGNTLQITNVMTNVTGSGPSQGGGIGNIGVGGTGKVKLGGLGTFNGNLDVPRPQTQTSLMGNGVTITEIDSITASPR